VCLWAQDIIEAEPVGSDAAHSYETRRHRRGRACDHLRTMTNGDRNIPAEQREVCSRYGVEPLAADANAKAGVARNVREGGAPLNGLRHPPERDTCGWYIWAGAEPSDDPDFFLALHVAHLAQWCPDALPYLALPAGWRFQVAPGHEDVWQDPTLLLEPEPRSRYACELGDQDSRYAVVLENDGKVVYAYLRDAGNIVADVWIHNVGEAPERPEWDDLVNAPFANPREYCRSHQPPLVGDPADDLTLEWIYAEGNVVAVLVSIRGATVARLEPGSTPGWSRFAKKDGPLARVLALDDTHDAPAAGW